MAIIKCPHCGKNASNNDRRCPNCDFEINRDELVCKNCGSADLIEDTENALKNDIKKGWLLSILAIILAPFCGSVLRDTLITTSAEGIAGSIKGNPKKVKMQLEKEGKAIYLCKNCKNHFIAIKPDLPEKK